MQQLMLQVTVAPQLRLQLCGAQIQQTWMSYSRFLEKIMNIYNIV